MAYISVLFTAFITTTRKANVTSHKKIQKNMFFLCNKNLKIYEGHGNKTFYNNLCLANRLFLFSTC